MIVAFSLKVALFLTLLMAIGSAHPVNAAIYQVTRVFSGEMIELSDGGKITPVRLVGLDAPEPAEGPGEPEQPFASSARNYLSLQVLNRDVTIKPYGSDSDGYLLAEVFRGDRNINLSMVQAGLAEAYIPRPINSLHFDIYREAEVGARRNKRGMWMLEGNYISPREWRRMRDK